MTFHRPSQPRMLTSHHQGGFTLIEVLIVVAILGLLSAVAIPQYSQHVQKSRRVEAAASLRNAQQFMQRFYAANDQFQQANGKPPELPADLKKVPANSAAPTYELTVETPTRSTFTLIATPTSTGSMATDVCGALTLDHRGAQGIKGTGKTVQDCWK
jgi:type IV pilus assembly protein PilE